MTIRPLHAGILRRRLGAVQAFSVKAGERVPTGKDSGSEAKLDGEENISRPEDDLLAIPEK